MRFIWFDSLSPLDSARQVEFRQSADAYVLGGRGTSAILQWKPRTSSLVLAGLEIRQGITSRRERAECRPTS